MRTSGDLRYPNAIWFTHMPCLFILDNPSCDALEVSITANGITHTVEHDTFSGCACVDMREYVQGLFVTFGTPSYGSRNKSGYAQVMTYNVRTRTGGTYTSVLSNANTMFVWGYLEPDETWNGRRTYTWFRGYPFFVDVYASASQTCTISGGGTSQSVTLGSKGLWHVPLSASAFAAASVVTLSCGGMTYTINADDCGEGVYLRWLDRHGRICHYLFRSGADRREIEADDGYFRPNLSAWDDSGWSGWNGHREQKTRSKRLTIGAALVDSDTYEMLCDLASSPMVEMMRFDEDWMAVRIDDGNWQKSKAALQEFECTIIFDEVTE